MTGKEFRAWASTIHDDAEIQVEIEVSYRETWIKLEPEKIRALLDSRPMIHKEEILLCQPPQPLAC